MFEWNDLGQFLALDPTFQIRINDLLIHLEDFPISWSEAWVEPNPQEFYEQREPHCMYNFFLLLVFDGSHCALKLGVVRSVPDDVILRWCDA